MEDYIQFSAKTKNEAITKACLELELPVTSLIFRLSVKAAPDSSESAANLP